MNSMPSAAATPILKHPSGFVSSDQHHQIVHLEHSYRISVCVKHVAIRDPVFAGTRHNHRIHTHQVSLIPRCGTRKPHRINISRAETSTSEGQQIEASLCQVFVFGRVRAGQVSGLEVSWGVARDD
jgi:hypothetical protein